MPLVCAMQIDIRDIRKLLNSIVIVLIETNVVKVKEFMLMLNRIISFCVNKVNNKESTSPI